MMYEYKKHRLVTYQAEESTLGYGFQIKSSSEVNPFLRDVVYKDEVIDVKEYFYVVILNIANKVIGYHKISEGGINATHVDIKLICKYALDNLATSVILTHNHPSGNMKPSMADIKLTEKASTALSVFDIQVLDHVIVSGTNEEDYYSFADNSCESINSKYIF